jgi:uridine kinase
MDVQPVLDLIAAAAPQQSFVLVGIGGHGGAGKSTLARAIPGAQVVGTDEFWNGREFELSRLQREVLVPLHNGTCAVFHGFDWNAGRPFEGARVVEPSGIVVIEGVCALHRMFRDAYDVRVWVEAPYGLRLARGIARDGEGARQTWEEVWMPSEDRYVARDDPVPSAHLIVDGSGGAAA